MDGEWLNRAGILAELVSFVLIAPEILGKERLGRVEEALEAWGRRNTRLPRRLFGGTFSVADPLPTASRELRQGPWFMATSITILVLVVGVLPILTWTLVLGLDIWLFVPVGLVASVGAAVYRLSLGKDSRVSAAGALLFLPFVLLGWVATVLIFGIVFALALLARVGVRFLSGQDRLRALVFGTGVVLLFGGMAAQFVSTF